MKKVILKCVCYAFVITLSLSCSSSTGLRKFEDDDMKKVIPEDELKKFQVSDDSLSSGTGTQTATVTATEVSTAVTQNILMKNEVHPSKKKRKRKAKKNMKNPSNAVTAQAAAPPMRRQEPMPFTIGEKLNYEIRYLGVTAAYLNMEVQANKRMNDRVIHHLFAKAKTLKLFELVYRVEDSIDSYWDYEGLFSHRFTMDLQETKQTRKVIELYDYDQKKSFYWNRVDHVKNGFSEQKEQHDIDLWSQDVLSAFYYLRVAPLPKVSGEAFSFPVILDGKQWNCVLHYLRTEKLYAGGRDFEANVYHLENFQNGEIKNKDNTVWISNDEHRYLLRVETKVRVGSFAVALEKIL